MGKWRFVRIAAFFLPRKFGFSEKLVYICTVIIITSVTIKLRDYGNHSCNIYRIVLRVDTLILLLGQDFQPWLCVGVYGALLLADTIHRLPLVAIHYDSLG